MATSADRMTGAICAKIGPKSQPLPRRAAASTAGCGISSPETAMVTDPGFVRGRGVELVVAGDGDSLDAGAEDEVAVVELPGTADVADVAGRVPLPDELEQPASATAAAASATIIGLLREGHMGRERNPPRAL